MSTPLTTADLQSGTLSNVIINNTQYDFQVILINPEGRFFVFRPDAIKDLTIVDAIDQYYCQGHLVYNNSYDVLERPAISQNSADTNQSANAASSYVFRGDARDILRITITPRLNTNVASPETDPTILGKISLNYEFVVHNVEDTMLENPGTKLRKLIFRDMYKQILSEKNIQFSTAELNTKTSYNAADVDREAKTGDAIKAVIQKAFPSDEGFNPIFGEFDTGETSLFFTAPAEYKADDCLQYLLRRHVSSAVNNYDKCFLRIERYPRRWTLTSLKSMFDRAYNKTNDAGGDFFLERFLLGGAGDGSAPSTLQMTISRSPALALYFADNNAIENFTFLPPSGEHTQDQVVTKMVHTYDYRNKAFYIDAEKNSYSNALSAYQDSYASKLKGGGGGGVSNLVSNKMRADNKNVQHVFSPAYNDPTQRLGVGRSAILKDAVFLNKTLTFRVKGATYRESGSFISIDRNNSLTDSLFDDKLLGIYLILQVQHTFIGNNYFNDLLCVKTYNYKDGGDQTGNYL